ncbi:MAG: SGNH/GDSL hydrolase family protein [Frankiaceae bacterium]
MFPTPEGNIITSTCTSTAQVATDPLIQSVSPAGTVNWVQPANVDHTAWACPPVTTDDHGTSYYEARNPDGAFVVMARSVSGAILWATPIGDYSIARDNAPALGADGNIYFGEWNGLATRIRGYATATGQPTTFDLRVPDLFGLYAWSGGLIVQTTNNAVEYWSYQGAPLHEYDVGSAITSFADFTSTPGADGAVFIAGFSGNCSISSGHIASVSKISPQGEVWTWTDTRSTQCQGATSLAAAPNGGVAILHVDYLLLPSSFTTFIGADGVTKWTHQLSLVPGDMSSGGSALKPLIDIHGTVALPAAFQAPCFSNPALLCDNAQVDFVSQGSGATLAPSVTISPVAQPGTLDNFHANDWGIDRGRLYVARTTDGVNPASASAFDVPILAQNYRVALQQAVLHPPPPAPSYVAMGDSYSSGEGNAPYLAGSDQTLPTADHCHRSNKAYGPLLDHDAHLGTLAFVACSGAVTADFFYRNHANSTEPAQLTQIPSHAHTITLTIGGNDLGFADVLKKCLRLYPVERKGYGCSKDKALTRTVTSRIDALKGSGGATTPDKIAIIPLKTVLRRIHQAAPKAHIYVAGYPLLFGLHKRYFQKIAAAPSGYACQVYRAHGIQGRFDYDDTQWLNAQARALDNAIASVVTQAAAGGVPVSYVTEIPDRFFGHGLCGFSQSWIFGLHLNLKSLHLFPWSFHPTTTGQSAGYERAFLAAMN